MSAELQAIHSVYCIESGMSPTYAVQERAYHDFLSKGFTVDDLRLVLRHLKRENQRMNGASYSLRVDRIFDFDYRRFDAFLSEARATNRNRRPAPTAKDNVIQLRERVVNPEQSSTMPDKPPRSFADVLKAVNL